MNILALDTTNNCGMAVLKTDSSFDGINLERAHSENLLNEIDQILAKNNLLVNELNCLGIVTGPGSFTGIRIGLAVVKGIVYALNTNIVKVNSFEVVAYNIKDKNFVVVLNSGNKEHYYAEFENNEMSNYGSGTVEEIREIAKKSNVKIYCRSDEDVFDYTDFVKVDVTKELLLNLIKARFNENRTCNINELTPLYVKQSQAEKTLKNNVAEKLSIFEANDYLELHKIDDKCFENNKWTEEDYKQELSLQDRKYFVAKLNGNTIGFLGFEDLGEELNILKVAVVPEFRKNKVASKLMERTIEYFEKSPAKQIFLEVRKSNLVAQKLYEKFGFKAEYERPNYYRNGENCLVMFLKKEVNEAKI